jgi:hypothetical protein
MLPLQLSTVVCIPDQMTLRELCNCIASPGLYNYRTVAPSLLDGEPHGVVRGAPLCIARCFLRQSRLLLRRRAAVLCAHGRWRHLTRPLRPLLLLLLLPLLLLRLLRLLLRPSRRCPGGGRVA